MNGIRFIFNCISKQQNLSLEIIEQFLPHGKMLTINNATFGHNVFPIEVTLMYVAYFQNLSQCTTLPLILYGSSLTFQLLVGTFNISFSIWDQTLILLSMGFVCTEEEMEWKTNNIGFDFGSSSWNISLVSVWFQFPKYFGFNFGLSFGFDFAPHCILEQIQDINMFTLEK